MQKKEITHFKDLEVFKISYRLSLVIHKLALKFPDFERFGMTSQILRASKSICANIAEGFSKQAHSKPEFRRFVSIACGSSNEMVVWLLYCRDLEYIDKEIFSDLVVKYEELSKRLQVLHQKIK